MIVDGHHIPDSELQWSFGPSGGPGGQHANRSHTRAEVRFDVGNSSSLPDSLKTHLLLRLGNRATGGVVTVTADDTRSQLQNRRLAQERLGAILNLAAHRPRPRRPTRPTVASRQRRLDQKRRRSELKQTRRASFD
jgi:ribosome-associated protein